MRTIITNYPEKCVGCNRCIRECPIDEANIAMEQDGKIVVRIDPEKCIACGACIAACPHDARDFVDDTERFFQDLRAGVAISVFSAPALKTNFSEWERILAYLRSLGVQKIYDVSLGADICTWAHIRYLQRNTGAGNLITQPCPAIVNYILKHRAELARNLSPIHSPMLCTAIYMRRYENVRTRIAAISPCIAKTHEFEDAGNVDYNITFENLQRYMREHGVRLPDEKSSFDHYESGLGFLYPMPGGLKENIEHYLGKSVRIDKSEGPHVVYGALDEYAEQPQRNLPAIFDVLNCAEGCNRGTGCTKEHKSIFEIQTTLNSARMQSMAGDGMDYLDRLYQRFDETFRLEDFVRQYSPAPVRKIPITQREIDDAFARLGKTDEASRKFNCGACGSKSCMDMAIKIAKGVNTPANCMEKAQRDISAEHEAAVATQAANIENLSRIMDDMLKIKSITENIVSNMSNVTHSIDDFSKMTADIQKIAAQINIISLNASIEAAKAGQFGKAFGVVADEVRKLANSSRTSVQNSEQASQKATEAIQMINDMISQVSRSVNESYDEIHIISENTNKMVKKI